MTGNTLIDSIPEPFRAIFYLVAMITFAALNAAYLVWAERKLAAHIQRRIGPKEVGPFGLLQPVADGIKLLSKQLLEPADVNRTLYWLAPILIIIPAIVSFVVIPFGNGIQATDMNLGLLLIPAFGSIVGLGFLMGGWGSRNKYAVISAARAVSRNIAYEVPLLLTIVTVVMITNSMDLNEIVAAQSGGFWHWNVFKLSASPLMPVLFMVYMICMLAESSRAPFDITEAESELVAGTFTDYAGMSFGLFFIGEYALLVVGCCIGTILFLGGWDCPFGMLPGCWWFAVKLYALCTIVIWVRWTFPRTQFYALLNLSWKVLIPLTMFNLLLTGLCIKLFR